MNQTLGNRDGIQKCPVDAKCEVVRTLRMINNMLTVTVQLLQG